jgi:hypothetical protein
MPAGLNTAHRTTARVATARVAAIRAPYPGIDTVSPNTGPHAGDGGAAAAVLAPVVHLADRTPRPARDGAVRHGQTATVDGQNRVNLGKALTALGWTPDTFLVAARENGHVVVRAGADSPLLTRVPVDAQRRLTLPPAVLAGLDVRRGEQVQAVAVVDTGELHLFAAADALQLLTGALPISAVAGARQQPVAAPAAQGCSRVKPAWGAAGRGQTAAEDRTGG